MDVVENKSQNIASSCAVLCFNQSAQRKIPLISLVCFMNLFTMVATSFSSEIHFMKFEPFIDETTLTAVNRRDLIWATLSCYHMSATNFICLIGNNCNTDYATADVILDILLGCCSHRLNSKVKAYVEQCLEAKVYSVTSLVFKLLKLKKGAVCILTLLWDFLKTIRHVALQLSRCLLATKNHERILTIPTLK